MTLSTVIFAASLDLPNQSNKLHMSISSAFMS